MSGVSDSPESSCKGTLAIGRVLGVGRGGALGIACIGACKGALGKTSNTGALGHGAVLGIGIISISGGALGMLSNTGY